MALAGGFEIVLACDLIVASREARFGLPEVTRGLIASSGLIVTGRSIDAERAFALGLINRIVAPSEVVTEAVGLARSICANAPLAILESLAIARAASGFDNSPLREAGDVAQARLARTADYQEGSRAFVEKRRPRWRAE
ncbi:MAG: enoyl-CoA hydratase-related protein [Sphingomicrobium sp.]